MKSKYYFPHTATVFFLLTVAVALFSWIGSIYGLGKVQSLLSPEGIRWELRHAMGNFVQTPALGIVMMLFLSGMAFGYASGRFRDDKEGSALRFIPGYIYLLGTLGYLCTRK